MKRIRNTVQRDVVLETVKHFSGYHPTAEDIYQRIAAMHPQISRGTVYRNLNVLCELGKVIRVSTESGADRYDACTHHHGHFQCLSCHRLFDVEMPSVICPDSLRAEGFVVEDEAVLLKGLCPDCAIKKREEKREHEGFKGN